MSWLNTGSDRQTTMAALPGITAAFDALYHSLWTQPHLPGETLELCRLRLAQLHRSSVDFARSEYALSDTKRARLTHWPTDDEFTEKERACLAFTEVYAMDAQAITDVLAEAVKEQVGDAGLVLLVEALGIFDGMTRLTLLWELPNQPNSQPLAGA